MKPGNTQFGRWIRPALTEDESAGAVRSGDPMELIFNLKRQVDALPDSEAGFAEAAVDVCLSLGRCTVFGIGSRSPLMLSQDGLRVALKSAVLWFENAANQARLALRIQVDPVQLFRLRLDAWALFLALDEAYSYAVEEGADEGPLHRTHRRVLNHIERIDNSLSSNPSFKQAARSQMFDRWRLLLAPRFGELAPWWMGG